MTADLVVAPYPPVDGTQPCASEDPELFFISPSGMNNYFQVPRALECCERCPFRRPCLAHALTYDLQGIWGGTTEPQRQKLRAEHGIRAVPVALRDMAMAREETDALFRAGATVTEVATHFGIPTATASARYRSYLERTQA